MILSTLHSVFSVENDFEKFFYQFIKYFGWILPKDIRRVILNTVSMYRDLTNWLFTSNISMCIDIKISYEPLNYCFCSYFFNFNYFFYFRQRRRGIILAGDD